MKSTVRVIAGEMKGKAIPFVNSRFGDADITPQKVKGAVFSILGESCDGLVFLDLYSGSGQMGIEAMSRGCSLAVFTEFSKQRFSFIKDFLENNCDSSRYLVFNMKAMSVVKLLKERNLRSDVIFLDPPYDREGDGEKIYTMLLDRLSGEGLAKEDAVIIVQHYAKSILPENAGRFIKRFTRNYGTSALSVYDGYGLSVDSSDTDIRKI